MKERDRKVESLESRAKNLNEKLAEKGQKIGALTESVKNLQKDHLSDINSRIQRAVKVAARREMITRYLIIAVFVVLVWFLSYLAENKQILQQFGVGVQAAKNLVIGGGVFVALIGFWFLPHVLFDGFLRRVWRKSLQKKAAELGVEEQLACCTINEGDRAVSECRTVRP